MELKSCGPMQKLEKLRTDKKVNHKQKINSNIKRLPAVTLACVKVGRLNFPDKDGIFDKP